MLIKEETRKISKKGVVRQLPWFFRMRMDRRSRENELGCYLIGVFTNLKTTLYSFGRPDTTFSKRSFINSYKNHINPTYFLMCIFPEKAQKHPFSEESLFLMVACLLESEPVVMDSKERFLFLVDFTSGRRITSNFNMTSWLWTCRPSKQTGKLSFQFKISKDNYMTGLLFNTV
jgi:hypothetical protein